VRSGLDLVLEQVRNMESCTNEKKPLVLPWGRTPRLDSGVRMDLFAFIRHSNPTKARVGERNLAEREVKLLEMTEGRTIPLNPPATAASGDSGDSIDKLFDEENDANQEHSVAKDDDVLEEVVALDAPGVGAEKAKKKR
ncbi:hypothetical protein Tco_1494921, partial [Tanacetum coccineum]